MTDTAVARSHGDIFELNVHVVFGYSMDRIISACAEYEEGENEPSNSRPRYTWPDVISMETV